MPPALDGIRVVDFGHHVAGPLAGVLLADQGADVVHVDAPDGRGVIEPADAFLNRGKRRITLDLKDPADLEKARRLIERADVVIENFRPGVMARLDLGAEELLEHNPRLIYCSLPGFAAEDPRSSMRAWEGVIHAATENCIPRVGEEPLDWDGSRPVYSALPLASNFAAFLGATGIVMALIARERCGWGQRVEVPLFDAMLTLVGHQGAYLESRGLHPPAPIHGHGAGSFRCADGRYVQFDTFSPRHLTWFARAAGITDWGADLLDIQRLRDPAANERLHARLRELFLTRTAEEWEAIGNAAGGCIGVARTVREWIDTDHARAIGAVVQRDDPGYGLTWMTGVPVHLDASPGRAGGPRHRPDADRDAVLAEINATPSMAEPGVTPASSLAQPLSGMRVLDVCLALAGPTCGRLLQEFGAEVIKISPPGGGVGGYLNRGKRSLLLDLDTSDGQDLYWRLVERADVVVENFSPGTADRLGIGYEEARARRPDLVYTSISCYGPGGPWSDWRGWERQGQAVSGIMERASETPAVLGPYNLVDHGTGVLATFATGLALYHRLRTGEGQRVHASLAQTGTYHQTPYMLDFAGYEPCEPRGSQALGVGPLQRFYQASDGWFFLGLRRENAHRLREVPGLENLDPGLPDADLEQELARRFACDDRDAWIERLRAAGVAAHAVTPIAEVMRDPAVRAQGLSITRAIDGLGEATMPGVSVRLSRTPMLPGAPSRRPGSDAAAILREVGMEQALDDLERRWVIRASDLPPAW